MNDRDIVTEIIVDAIRLEPYSDHGEPPSAETYASVVIADLKRNGYTIERTA